LDGSAARLAVIPTPDEADSLGDSQIARILIRYVCIAIREQELGHGQGG
jgi:hypothetical protein